MAKKVIPASGGFGGIPYTPARTVNVPTKAATNSKITPTKNMAASNTGLFVGPIPTGSTRTQTGYVTPEGQVVVESYGPDATAGTVGLTDAELAAQQAAALAAAAEKRRQVDAIAAISALLSSYGIGDLTASITDAVIKGYSSDTIQLMMQDPKGTDPLAVAFQARFPANKARLAAGKSVLSASEYLQAERSYSQVMQSYGVANLATKDKITSFLTNDISAAEVSDRVSLAINRVQNADPETKKALAEYYPMLNQGDIVGAVLSPTEGLPALQRKVQIGEIGGAALSQNLRVGLSATSGLKTDFLDVTGGSMGAQALADLGITKEQARAGFQQVAEVLPRGEFLTSITASGEQYGQIAAEQEAFKGLASAKRARQVLTEEEKARFGGSSGMSKTSLTNQSRGSF